MVGSAAAVAEAATDGPSSLGTPGLYAYTASSPQYTTMQFYTTVTNDPGDGANVFWSHQFSTADNSGYIGFQATSGNGTGRPVLFSVWGATDCRTGEAALGAYCTSGTETTDFKSARIYYPWKAGVKYRLTVAQAPAQGAGWWTAYLYDPTTNVNHRIGYLKFGGATGGTVSPEVSWVEYFNWNDPNAICGNQINSSAVFSPITGSVNGKTVAAVPYTSTTHSSTCTYADQSSISGSSANLVVTSQTGAYAPPTATSLTASTQSVSNGSTVTFAYATPAGTASSSNWIGVYKQGTSPGNGYSTDWQTASGERGSKTFTFNYGPGTYQVYYLYNDGYQVLSGPITVTVQ
ncbi:hypothetical protein Back2_28810 [Nocardioides baekrokdamisoli]|uniref:DUF3472 domain-containing protein n=2 Tax=Nocardioides baekrokdamisoli TaxID=1804624 RepID=A0A3G9J5I6_9ACTN|nr:hypothetical protein Back2_28810 [Nocardioides baekrokdamisoli]